MVYEEYMKHAFANVFIGSIKKKTKLKNYKYKKGEEYIKNDSPSKRAQCKQVVRLFADHSSK